MKYLLILVLLISFAAKGDNQAPLLPKKTKPEYQLGQIVVFKIEKFYWKACRSPQIPGFNRLEKDETIGIVDQYIDGEYRIVKVKCNSNFIWGFQHFDVDEEDIVKVYVPPKPKKKKKKIDRAGVHSDYLP